MNRLSGRGRAKKKQGENGLFAHSRPLFLLRSSLAYSQAIKIVNTESTDCKHNGATESGCANVFHFHSKAKNLNLSDYSKQGTKRHATLM